MGVKTIGLTEKKGGVAGALIVREHHDLVFISQNGMVQRTGVKGISKQGRPAQGVRVMNLREDDQVSAVALVMETAADTGAEVAEELPDRGRRRRGRAGRGRRGRRVARGPVSGSDHRSSSRAHCRVTPPSPPADELAPAVAIGDGWRRRDAPEGVSVRVVERGTTRRRQDPRAWAPSKRRPTACLDPRVCFNWPDQGKEVVRALSDRFLGTLEVSGR